ncbi:hypothetical protein Dimus_002744 [Dionaea muscipula]
MDSDTQSSNSRTNPQRPVSSLNRRAAPPRPEEGEARLLDSTGSTPKVGDTVDKHKENKLCVERTQERERDRRAEVRRRRTEKIASQQALGKGRGNKMN